MKAAFQGEAGANGHVLCLEAFPDYEPRPCATFEEAFAAVRSGECALGLIAMENSTVGRVADVHNLLRDSGLRIVGERFMRIVFDLMVSPGAELAGLRSVRSHPMALAQCRRLIAELGLRAEAALDTAGAARALAESPDPSVAVLAPADAARRYGLEVLRTGVEDDPQNTTRFIVVAREDGALPIAEDAPCLTSLTFKTRDVPAALYKALGSFASNGVNLWKLESYVEGRGQFRAASFYAEVAGRPSDPPVESALNELAFFSSEYEILGVYAADPARRGAAPAGAPAPAVHTASAAPEVEEHGWADALSRLRHSIDNIDAAVIHLLAERFKVTRQVGALKARHALPASDPAREARQLERLQRLAAAADLDPGFAHKFLAFVIAEVVRHHERMRQD